MTISNCAIDRIHVATTVDKLDALKNSVCLATASNSWEDVEPDGRYRESIKDSNTGITIKWNELSETSKNPQNGKVLCTIVGDWLREQSLKTQLVIPVYLNQDYSISRLDLKLQLNYPVCPIVGLQEIAYQTGLGKYPEIDYNGADGFVNHDSGWKADIHRSRTVEFVHAKHDKDRLVIYDPLVTHGIANAQHWERRLRGHYVDPVLRKLEPNRKDVKLSSKLITELVFKSVDFTWKGKTMSWYKQVKNAPIVM